MTATALWKQFSEYADLPEDTPCDAWAFGDSPDTLAALVLSGIKTATSSARALYDAENEELPRVGEYSVILDSCENAVCIVRTTRVYVVQYAQISAEHAWREGEGDRSLRYWQSVHEPFFRECLREAGLLFSTDMEVVCEEFEKVYP